MTMRAHREHICAHIARLRFFLSGFNKVEAFRNVRVFLLAHLFAKQGRRYSDKDSVKILPIVFIVLISTICTSDCSSAGEKSRVLHVDASMTFISQDPGNRNGIVRLTVSSDFDMQGVKVEILKPQNIDDISGVSIWQGNLSKGTKISLDNHNRVNLDTDFKIKGVISGRLKDGSKIGLVKYLFFHREGEGFVVSSEEEMRKRESRSLSKTSDVRSNPFNELTSRTALTTAYSGKEDSLIISGKVQFMDARHIAQDLIYARVELVRKTSSDSKVLQIGSTNEWGDYRFSTPADSSLRITDCYVRVLTEGPSDPQSSLASIVEVLDGVFKTPYYAVSTPFTVAVDSPRVKLDMVVDESVDWGACTVFQHIVNGWLLTREQLEVSLDKVVVLWPSSYSSYGDTIRILQGDRWDRDVVLHEYGHFVDRQFKITETSGGDHFLDENLSTRYDPETAKRLAWGEGWADFFAVAIQYAKTSDSYYDDTEDVNIHFNLDGPIKHLGTDCEAAVACILWDIFDSDDRNEPFDNLALGLGPIWKLLTRNGTFTNIEKVKSFWQHSAIADYDKFLLIYSQYTSPTSTPTLVARDTSSVPLCDITIITFPNPFNCQTALQYSLSNDGFVDLSIYDILGRKVNTLVLEYETAAGRHAVRWLGTDSNNAPVASGIYFGVLRAEGQTRVVRMVLAK